MRPTLSLFFAATLAVFGCGAVVAQERPLSKAEQADSRRFAAHNSLFVLYHEVAHLLFDQLSVPVLGREEDAADNMASWLLLKKRSKEADQALADAAQGWVLSGVAYDSGGMESDFYAAHSLDKQRAFQIVCLMVGSDQKAFRSIANQYRIDRDRQDSCQVDFDTVARSFEAVLGGGKYKTDGTSVTVTYHPAEDDLRAAADAFRSSGVFDQVAQELRTKYKLRRHVRFNARSCGEANAYYDPESVEVIFCYELMQDYMDLYTGALAEEGSGKTKSR